MADLDPQTIANITASQQALTGVDPGNAAGVNAAPVDPIVARARAMSSAIRAGTKAKLGAMASGAPLSSMDTVPGASGPQAVSPVSTPLEAVSQGANTAANTTTGTGLAARGMNAVKGFGAGLSRVTAPVAKFAGPVAGGLTAISGAADAAEHGTNLHNVNAMAVGGAGVASAFAPALAVPTLAVGGGELVGHALTPDSTAMTEASAASKILGGIPGLGKLFRGYSKEGTVPTTSVGAAAEPYLARLQAQRAKEDATGQAHSGGFGAGTAIAPVATGTATPAPAAAQPAVQPLTNAKDIAAATDVLAHNGPVEPGTGVIRNNLTGGITRINRPAGYGAATAAPESGLDQTVNSFFGPGTAQQVRGGIQTRRAQEQQLEREKIGATYAASLAHTQVEANKVNAVPDLLHPGKATIYQTNTLTGQSTANGEPIGGKAITQDTFDKFVTKNPGHDKSALIEHLKAQGYDVTHLK